MGIYGWLLRPILFQMDPEEAHHFSQRAALTLSAGWPLAAGFFQYQAKDLEVRLAGVRLDNPVGLAAGFDKNGVLVGMLGHVGFGFAEVGSATARPSAGNPRPRLFRLASDEALINRLGLNGDGAEVIARRLAGSRFTLPVGLNISKTNDPSITGDKAVEDILFTFAKVRDLPVAYVTVNASCPNTKEGILAEKEGLSAILDGMQKQNQRRLPIFVKLSPDSSEQLLEDLVDSARRFGVAGFVCGNTTVTRGGLVAPAGEVEKAGPGGLSGPPLRPLALNLCRCVYRLKSPDQQIIAVGGIASGQHAYDFIRNGAVALQIYTALVYHGPSLPRRICTELSALLKRDGLTISEAVGADLR